MNRRSFLSLSLAAPVAGVMAARDAPHEIFIGEHVGESLKSPPVVRKLMLEVDMSTLEGQLAAFDRDAKRERDAESAAQAMADPKAAQEKEQTEIRQLFSRDEPGVAV
jgi:hypothetical protein